MLCRAVLRSSRMSSGVQVEQLPVPCIGLGEGPHWIQEQQALVFVDAFDMKLRRYFVDSGKHQVLNVG